jgi:hypothetical protein
VTVTVKVVVAVHPPLVPLTVYVVVLAGLAVAVEVPVEVTPADHVYDVAPDAVRLAAEPLQTEGEFTVTVGPGVTVTVTGIRYVPGQNPT